jgi:hypothetical protein
VPKPWRWLRREWNVVLDIKPDGKYRKYEAYLDGMHFGTWAKASGSLHYEEIREVAQKVNEQPEPGMMWYLRPGETIEAIRQESREQLPERWEHCTDCGEEKHVEEGALWCHDCSIACGGNVVRGRAPQKQPDKKAEVAFWEEVANCPICGKESLLTTEEKFQTRSIVGHRACSCGWRWEEERDQLSGEFMSRHETKPEPWQPCAVHAFSPGDRVRVNCEGCRDEGTCGNEEGKTFTIKWNGPRPPDGSGFYSAMPASVGPVCCLARGEHHTRYCPASQLTKIEEEKCECGIRIEGANGDFPAAILPECPCGVELRIPVLGGVTEPDAWTDILQRDDIDCRFCGAHFRGGVWVKEKPWRPKVGEWVWGRQNTRRHAEPLKYLRPYYPAGNKNAPCHVCARDGGAEANVDEFAGDVFRPLALSEVETEEQARQFYGRKAAIVHRGRWCPGVIAGYGSGLKFDWPGEDTSECWYVRGIDQLEYGCAGGIRKKDRIRLLED